MAFLLNMILLKPQQKHSLNKMCFWKFYMWSQFSSVAVYIYWGAKKIKIVDFL